MEMIGDRAGGMGEGDPRCRFNASRCTSGGLVVCCRFGGLAFWYMFHNAILDISRALSASRETSGLCEPGTRTELRTKIRRFPWR